MDNRHSSGRFIAHVGFGRWAIHRSGVGDSLGTNQAVGNASWITLDADRWAIHRPESPALG